MNARWRLGCPRERASGEVPCRRLNVESEAPLGEGLTPLASTTANAVRRRRSAAHPALRGSLAELERPRRSGAGGAEHPARIARALPVRAADARNRRGAPVGRCGSRAATVSPRSWCVTTDCASCWTGTSGPPSRLRSWRRPTPAAPGSERSCSSRSRPRCPGWPASRPGRPGKAPNSTACGDSR